MSLHFSFLFLSINTGQSLSITERQSRLNNVKTVINELRKKKELQSMMFYEALFLPATIVFFDENDEYHVIIDDKCKVPVV